MSDQPNKDTPIGTLLVPTVKGWGKGPFVCMGNGRGGGTIAFATKQDGVQQGRASDFHIVESPAQAELLSQIHELVACLRWTLETFVPDVDGDELTATYGENTCLIHEVCLDHVRNYDAICEDLELPRASWDLMLAHLEGS